MEIRIAVPRVPAGLVANLLGVLGLAAFALAVGGLAGNWWWSVLVGAVFAVGLSYIAQTQAAAATPLDEAVRATDGVFAEVRSAIAKAQTDEETREQAYIRGLPTPVSA